MRTRSVVAAVCGGALALLSFLPTVRAQGAFLNKSGPIQVTANGQQIWCVNPDHGSVTKIVDGGTFFNASQIPLPSIGQKHNPRGLAIRPGSPEVWIPTQDSDRIYIFSTDFNTLQATLTLPTGSAVGSIVFTPDGSHAILSGQRAEQLIVINAATRTTETTVPVFRRPNGMCFTSNPNELWVTHTLPEGDTDGFPWEFAQFGAGTRSTFTLIGQSLTVGPQVGGLG